MATTLLGRGTRLDRADWTTLAHNTGAPDASVKGNYYIDDNTNYAWSRAKIGVDANAWGSWAIVGQDSLWTRSEPGYLAPINTGDGITVSTTSGKTIDLSTNGTGDGSGNISLTADGDTGNITLTTKDIASETEGLFTVNAARGIINAPEGLLLTNTADSGHADGVAFLKLPDINSSYSSTWQVYHMYTEVDDILIETASGSSCQADIYLDSCDHILGRADSQIRLNGKEGVLLSNGDGVRGESLIGDAWLKIPDSEDVWENMVDGFKFVHLYNGDGDIKIETNGGTYGDITCTTNNCGTGDFSVDLDTCGSGDITFATNNCGTGDFSVDLDGGSSCDITFTTDNCGSGDFSVTCGTLTNTGNITFTTKQVNSSNQGLFTINAGTLNFNDYWLSNFITLSESGETALDTSSNSLVGAINEVKATADGRERDIEYTKEVTGFNDPKDNPIDISYDPTTRKITLTDDGGTFGAMYRGAVVPELVNGWESDAHPVGITEPYFLSYGESGFFWSTTRWDFSEIQNAYVFADASGVRFAARETHGTMPHQSHDADHWARGTYRRPDGGGDVTGLTLDSTTPDDRRPLISECEIWDEDLPSTIAAKTVKTNYTTLYLDGASADIDDTVDYAEIVQLDVSSMPLVNVFSGGAWTKLPLDGNEHMAVWLLLVPVTSDAGSQKYRHIFVAGQAADTDVGVIEGRTVNDLTLDPITGFSPESVFIEKIILKANPSGTSWKIYSQERLTGTRAQQVASPSGNYLSTVSADTFKLTATTTTTGATSDSADMLLSDGSYLTVDAGAITAFQFSIQVAVKSSSDAGFFGSRKFTGEFQTGSSGSVFGTLTYDDGEYAPSGHTVTNPAISIDGSDNLIISCEHESTSSGDCIVEHSATLQRIAVSDAKIGS